MGIRVKALQRGYYGSLREPGDEFVIAKKEDMGSWMVDVAKLPEKPGRRGKTTEEDETDTGL